MWRRILLVTVAVLGLVGAAAAPVHGAAPPTASAHLISLP